MLALCQIPGYLKLSLYAISKQGLRHPEWTLEGIQAPEYRRVTTGVWSTALPLFAKLRGAQGPEILLSQSLQASKALKLGMQCQCSCSRAGISGYDST